MLFLPGYFILCLNEYNYYMWCDKIKRDGFRLRGREKCVSGLHYEPEI